MSTRRGFCGVKRPVRRADNLTTFTCRLSRTSGSLNLLEPSRHAQRLIYNIIRSISFGNIKPRNDETVILKANSHTPHRAPAVLCRGLEKSLLERHGQNTAGARHGVCELKSAVSRRPVDDLPSFGFFRLLRGHSRRLLARKLLPFGVCQTVLLAMETVDYPEHELTLQLKSIFLLLLCYVSTVFFS